MDFDRIAEQYPVLYDLMGIASQMLYQDSIKKQVIYDYIKSILTKLNLPLSVLRDYREVMGMTVYEEEIA